METTRRDAKQGVEAQDRPLVCVAIPVYNGATFIESAVRSALRQTYPRLRVVVADNASTDDTREVLAGIQDERLSCRFFTEHVPVAASFDRALKHAEGDLVLLLASDNELEVDAIATLVAALQAHPSCGLAYGRVRVTNDGGAPRAMGQALRQPRVGLVTDLERAILDDGYTMPLDGVLFRRDIPELRFDSQAKGSCDLDLLLRVGRSGVMAVGTDAQVAMLREHRVALSEKRERMWGEALAVLERLRGASVHASRYDRRMARMLTWLTVYLVQGAERDTARAYRRRYATVLGPVRSALLGAMIAVPVLRYAPLTARRLWARGMRRLEG